MTNATTLRAGPIRMFMEEALRLKLGMRAKLRLWAKQREVYNRTWSELSNLSDHDLADLGFCKADVQTLARGAASMCVDMTDQ